MKFRIPKQTDRMLLEALIAIKNEIGNQRPIYIEVLPTQHGSSIKLPDAKPEEQKDVQVVLNVESQVMPWLQLRDKTNNHSLISINRQPDQITDQLNVIDDSNWVHQVNEAERTPLLAKLVALARKHFRVDDTEAALNSTADSEWSRYRDAQQVILGSLEETQRAIVLEYNKRVLEADAATKQRLDQSELELKAKYDALEKSLNDSFETKAASIAARESEIETREKSFNTREARYVARQEQQNQIKQIQGWLEGWSLTKGTRAKRLPVYISCWIGMIASGGFAIYYSLQSVDLLHSLGPNLTNLAWWQWALLSLRSIVPLATFIAIAVFLIRWSAAWARQHAEEEFRNRARVLDIGRTAWLIEAVRDAQDNQKELPPQLLQDLARNLFAYPATSDANELQPHNISDILLQGLSSVRVKSPDGTELEARRRRLLP